MIVKASRTTSIPATTNDCSVTFSIDAISRYSTDNFEFKSSKRSSNLCILYLRGNDDLQEFSDATDENVTMLDLLRNLISGFSKAFIVITMQKVMELAKF